MKELVVISGKGGTGKTSIVACFAALAESKVLADCDVDAADLHLVLEPQVRHREDFRGGKQARVIVDRCVACGTCEEVCRFGAVSFDGPPADEAARTFRVDPIACEGCGVCYQVCPVEAIEFEDVVNGEWFVSETRHGPMVHAKLGIAEENSGKLVTLVRNQAKRLAEERNVDLVIIDGSPGIGCPVIASITGSNLVMIVTEPTLSGLHDLERVAALAAHFQIPTVVCINKCDLNEEMSERIVRWCSENGARVVGKIAYDRAFTEAMVNKESLVEYCNGTTTQGVKTMWSETLDVLR